jgi:elongation factor Ts
MANFTAKDVQELRRETGAGMLDAKRALEESGGDREAAKRWLRVQGLAGAAKREGREALQGLVSIRQDGSVAALVEVRCETDFVAKSPELVSLGDAVAGHLLGVKGDSQEELTQAVLDVFEEQLNHLKTTLKENISLGTVARVEAGPGEVLGSYLHTQAGRGVNGVIVTLAGGTPELAHDVAVHIAFGKPKYLSRDEVPPEEVEAERETIVETAKREGKPEAAMIKIVEGRLNAWYQERCLLEQKFVRDESKTVNSLLGDARVTGFVQVVVGS